VRPFGTAATGKEEGSVGGTSLAAGVYGAGTCEEHLHVHPEFAVMALAVVNEPPRTGRR